MDLKKNKSHCDFVGFATGGMSVDDYSGVPRNVVLDDGDFYKTIYEDRKILITTCKERIYWLRQELINW